MSKAKRNAQRLMRGAFVEAFAPKTAREDGSALDGRGLVAAEVPGTVPSGPPGQRGT